MSSSSKKQRASVSYRIGRSDAAFRYTLMRRGIYQYFMSSIILFDGVCNFCSGSVKFIIERDKEGHFKFAPLQSEVGQKLLDEHGVDKKVNDSIVLIENGKAFLRSTAALRIARKLSGAWAWLYGFIIIPASLRDIFYDLFAKYRYRLFGKLEVCMLPTPEIRGRFLARN